MFLFPSKHPFNLNIVHLKKSITAVFGASKWIHKHACREAVSSAQRFLGAFGDGKTVRCKWLLCRVCGSREIPHTESHYPGAGWPHCARHRTTLTSCCKKIGAHALLNYLDGCKQTRGEWAQCRLSDGVTGARESHLFVNFETQACKCYTKKFER